MSLSRRAMFVTFAGLAVAIATAAMAAPPEFEAGAFESARAEGKPILLHVTAPWCGTCRAQKPILSRLLTKPDLDRFAHFNVDFGTQKEAVKRFGVRYQTTLIVFKGGEEVGRSQGDTNPETIEALLRKAL